MRRAGLFLFFAVLSFGVYGFEGNLLQKPRDISIQRIHDLFEEAFFAVELDDGTIIIRDADLTTLIFLAEQENVISMYSMFQVSESPMGPQRAQIIQGIFNDWANRRIFLRTYISNDKRSVIADAHLSYKAGITFNQIIEFYKTYKDAVGVFSADCGKAISDTAITDIGALLGPTKESVFAYIQNVLNPTMKEVGHTVRLENDDLIIIHKPDMQYSLIDKRSGRIENGMRGFNTDAGDFSTGTVYYFESGPMSIDDFLAKTNYTETSKTVVVPIACNEKTVTYSYLKPEEKRGQVLVFNITEVKN